MGLNIVVPLEVFETEKDLDDQHTGANDKNSFLKKVETDLFVSHSATGASTATLKGTASNTLSVQKEKRKKEKIGHGPFWG